MTDAFTHLWLPILGVVFAGGMALLAMVRGVLRLVRLIVALGVGFAAGTLVFLHAPEWFGGVNVDLPGKWIAALSVLAGAIGHFGSSFVLSHLFGAPGAAQAAGRSIPAGRAILLSLVPSALILWIGGVLIRLGGSLSGMAAIDQGQVGDWPWLVQARAGLSQGVLGRFFNLTDPVATSGQVRLCEILVAYRESDRWKTVRHDPHLRAVVVHPKFQRLLDDREVRRAVAFSNYPRLLTLREVREAADDPSLANALRSLPAPEVRRAEPVP